MVSWASGEERPEGDKRGIKERNWTKRVAELELGVVGVKERVVVRRSSKRREMIGCRTVITAKSREMCRDVQGCAPSEWIAYSNFMRLPRLALGSVKSKSLREVGGHLGPPPPKRPNCSYQIFALASDPTNTSSRARGTQSVGPSIHPLIQSTRTPSSLWPQKATMH